MGRASRQGWLGGALGLLDSASRQARARGVLLRVALLQLLPLVGIFRGDQLNVTGVDKLQLFSNMTIWQTGMALAVPRREACCLRAAAWPAC